MLFSNNTFNPLTFFYGFRDILLLSFIVYFIKNPFKIKKHKYNLLIFIIFGFSIIQLLSQFFGYLNILDFIFKTEQYYSNKGIISNTSGGFFGDRLTIPLYSSSLLGTFCAFYFFKTNFRGKFLSFIIGFFTLSKSIILIPIFHFLKKFYRLFIFCLFAVLFFVRNFIDYYIENNDASILTYHLGSVRDRFYSIDMLFDKLPLMSPEILGTNSIAAKSFLGLDPSTAPESLIIARLLDYNIFIILPIIFIVIYIYNNYNKEHKFLFSVVLILCFFSNLSNHPIAFLPIITNILAINSISSQKNFV